MQLLTGVPKIFEDELLARYRQIERNFREGRWEPSELNGGKLCEVAYSILRGHVDGNFGEKPTKPSNFAQSCNELEKADAKFGRSVRLLIPRMLIPLYDIRNSRSVGHIGGDVDPNHMDALCVLQMSKWIVSEMIRLFFAVSVQEARDLVEKLTDRHIDIIWDTGKIRRVLDTSLSMLQKSLLLLYGEAGELHEKVLCESIEHSNLSVYRRDVLRKAHKDRLIEYDPIGRTALISPKGIKKVEEEILVSS